MDKTTFWSSSSAPIGSNLLKKSSDVASYCYVSGNYNNDNLSSKDKKIQSDKILIAQKNFFDFFPFQFVEGNKNQALPDENSICLSQEIALQLFGNEKAIGKEVVFENKKLVVRGVYKIDNKLLFKMKNLYHCRKIVNKLRIKRYNNFTL